jgi:hypothetical protein
MRKTILYFTGLFILLFVGGISAQEPTRIQFAKGKSSGSVNGSTGTYGKAYAIRARSGQKLIITVAPRSGVGVKVETLGRYGHQVLLNEERGGTYEVGLEESGDYTIFLGSRNGRSAAFMLTVRIEKMADI